MTQQTPDEIRREIEETRARLSSDVDAVAEKVSPAAAMDRQKNRIKDGLTSMKDKIMGSDDTQVPAYGQGAYGEQNRVDQVRDGVQDAAANVQQTAAEVGHDVKRKANELGDSAAQAADDAKRKIAQAPAAVQHRTQGNPLAAGLIAFGAGMLVASLIPASRMEQDAAEQLKQKAEPLMQDATEAAKQFAEDAKGPIAEAGEQLRQTAAEGFANVRGEGEHHAQNLAGTAQDSAQNVKDA